MKYYTQWDITQLKRQNLGIFSNMDGIGGCSTNQNKKKKTKY